MKATKLGLLCALALTLAGLLVACGSGERSQDENAGAESPDELSKANARPLAAVVPDPAPGQQNMFLAGYLYADSTTAIELQTVPRRLAINMAEFHEGLAEQWRGGLWGFVDTTGEFVIEPQYEGALLFSEGLAGVKAFDAWGFVDRQGKLAIKHNFAAIKPFTEGLAAVKAKNGLWGYIDKTGAWAIQPQFHQAQPFADGLAAAGVKKMSPKTRWGFIDKTGKFVVPAQFDFLDTFFSEGLCMAVPDAASQSYVFIDRKGQTRLGPFPYIGSLKPETLEKRRVERFRFKRGLALRESLAEDGSLKAGLIDTSGAFVVPPVFDKIIPAGFAASGLMAARQNGKWGYIDAAGAWKIKPRFAAADFFKSGYACAGDKIKGWGYIDTSGAWAIPPRYVWALPFHNPMQRFADQKDYGWD